MKFTAFFAKITAGIGAVTLFALGAATLYADWSAPLTPPPTCRAGDPGCDAPIHAGAAAQVKKGKFGIGTRTPMMSLEVTAPSSVFSLPSIGLSYPADNSPVTKWLYLIGPGATQANSEIIHSDNTGLTFGRQTSSLGGSITREMVITKDGKVAIGTNPQNFLADLTGLFTVFGTIKITDGQAQPGRVLTAVDSKGLASWKNLPALSEADTLQSVVNRGKTVAGGADQFPITLSRTDQSGTALEVFGKVLIQDTTQGKDKILTSDQEGLASWKSLSQIGGGAEADTLQSVTARGATTDRAIETNGFRSKQDAIIDGRVGIGDDTPSALLSVGSGDKFRVDANGHLRLNGSTDPLNGLADTSFSRILSFANSSAPFNTSKLKVVYGIIGEPQNNGAGDIRGISIVPVTGHAGTVGNVYGVTSGVRTANKDTLLTNGAAFVARTPHILTGGRITNAYGIFINPQKDTGVTGVTNGYGIYQTGADDTNIFLGNVGIGTKAPSAKLDVAGKIKIADGTERAGRVLTSNAQGLASWQDPQAGGGTYSADSSLTLTGTRFGLNIE
ncbi:MAG: putative membrane-anchored cell surface protein, partial [Parcubacteria group bacterium Greene0416_79]